jgi:hypothetical protein
MPAFLIIETTATCLCATSNPISYNDPTGMFQQSPQAIQEEYEMMNRAQQGGGGYSDPGMDELQSETNFNTSMADDYTLLRRRERRKDH